MALVFESASFAHTLELLFSQVELVKQCSNVFDDSKLSSPESLAETLCENLCAESAQKSLLRVCSDSSL